VTPADPDAPDPDAPDPDAPDLDGPDPHPDEPPSDAGRSLDAQFDAIVAGLDLQPSPSPVDDEHRDGPDEPQRPTGPGSFEELRAWVDVHPDLLAGPEPDELLEADQPPEDHYLPPPPPPLPRGDRLSRWAWAGAVGAPLGYVLLALFGQDLGGVLGFTLIGAFVAGFVTLVLRMRDGPRVDDGPDDGAVV
jgi:hypothetical protein